MMLTSRGVDEAPGTIGGVAVGAAAEHAPVASATSAMAAKRVARARGTTRGVYDAPNGTAPIVA
jgi:hypothetical protein